jgi:hypothetical protein
MIYLLLEKNGLIQVQLSWIRAGSLVSMPYSRSGQVKFDIELSKRGIFFTYDDKTRRPGIPRPHYVDFRNKNQKVKLIVRRTAALFPLYPFRSGNAAGFYDSSPLRQGLQRIPAA